MKKPIVALLALACLTLSLAAGAAAPPPKKFDDFGVWRLSRAHSRFESLEGARVIDFPEEESFAALWLPPGKSPTHLLYLLHGTGGTAYEEIKDEIDLASREGYALASIQWFEHSKKRYKAASEVLTIIERTHQVLASQFGLQPIRAGLSGFSRGSAVSFEIAKLDHDRKNLLSYFICHSGGIPLAGRLESKSPSGLATNADDFFRQINGKTLPKGIYTGKTFFLYSGDRDEQWGQEMSRKMGNARSLIEFYGGTVAEWATEANGKHMGYRLIPGIHERAIRGFLRPQ